MDDLICRSLKGRASEAEEASLLAWRRESPRNEAYYRDLLRLLEAAEEAALHTPAPPPPPVAKLIVGSGRSPWERTGRGPAWTRTARLWAGAAAAAVIAAVLLGLPAPGTAPRFSLGAGEFVTGPAETATVVLADGTVVRLAPDSRLRMPGESGTREVFLDGQAYFAVAKMKDHPFRVRTQAGEAMVLGTRFELRSDGKNLRLVVLEGRVALNAEGKRVEVGAGEMSLVSDGTTTAPVRVRDVTPLVSWLDRFIVFQSTPLREVALELEREYAIRVEVTDSTLAEQTVTGWYADRRFEDVLTIVCGVLQATCSIEDGTARIEPGGHGASVVDGRTE